MRDNEKIALSITEAAAALGVSRPTMYNIARTEGFPAFKIGNRTLISRKGLEMWVQERAGDSV